jgi:hypothetical protein
MFITKLERNCFFLKLNRSIYLVVVDDQSFVVLPFDCRKINLAK